MSKLQMDRVWSSYSRVRLLGQPIGLGIPLTLAGGFLTWNMIRAFNLQEPLWLQLATLGLILGSGFMLWLGVCNLLAPLEKVWVSPKEVQLRLGSLILRRIPAEEIISVSASTREVMIRSKGVNLYRLKIHCKKGPGMWIDWTVETEAALKENLSNAIFLF